MQTLIMLVTSLKHDVADFISQTMGVTMMI